MISKLLPNFCKDFFRRRWKKTFALHELDLKLTSYLDFTEGFFVEVGANDGIRQSNTLLLEKHRNWTGLLIEAIPSLAKRCKLNRPKCLVENCALVSLHYSVPFIEMSYCDLMSVVKGSMKSSAEEEKHLASGQQFLRRGEQIHTIRVPVMTLSGLLDKHAIARVDLLSLDVEGYEPQVLGGIDFERHGPSWMLIEVRTRNEILNIIGSRYEEVATLHSCDSYDDVLYKRVS